jgi:cold shock CspA family protein
MLFIDGTWLYSNTSRLADSYGKGDFQLDFGRLPPVLAEEISSQLHQAEVDIVRTYLFGSYAANYDPRDHEVVQRRLDFFSMLKEEYHYELEIFPINFRGRRLRRADRDPRDPFEPKEKCVDISLATTMLYFAAIPYAYDVAVAVIGDQDFKPVLQHVRRLGKRVAIASIQGSCTPEFAHPRDDARVRDFDIIWLDDLLHRLELKYERHQQECQSPIHTGDRRVWTTFYPRKGQKFFCDVCRAAFAGHKQEALNEYANTFLEEAPAPMGSSTSAVERPMQSSETWTGIVKKKVTERGFGFIQAEDGKDYFFHCTDLEPGLPFETIEEGLEVDFVVRKEPDHERAGAAQNVRRHQHLMDEQ